MHGFILLHLNIGDLYVRVWFGVVKKRTGKVLLGTPFIEKFVKGIFPQDGFILPIHATTVPILVYGVDQDETPNYLA